MTNKWKIALFVDETEMRILTKLLSDEVRERREQVALVADETAYCTAMTQIQSLAALMGQIKLSWIEKEEELIPPPSKWSQHCPVVVDHATNPL